jgi:probable phosphoglycerate mutase
MLTRIILIRHAEAEGNANRVFHGWTDAELTKKGHIQAGLVAERIKDTKIDVLYSSSMKRTLQTAQYISGIKNLPIIRTDKLKEINGGDWEGRAWHELPVLWPLEYDTWENKPHIHKMPNGESMEEFQMRLITEIQTIIEKNKGKNICIVTHGTAIKALICFFKECTLEEMLNVEWCDNTGVTVLCHKDGKYNFEMQGDASRLSKSTSTIENQEWYKEYKDKFTK